MRKEENANGQNIAILWKTHDAFQFLAVSVMLPCHLTLAVGNEVSIDFVLLTSFASPRITEEDSLI